MPPIPVPLNQWSHVALTYNGTNRIFYVNGSFAGSGSASSINISDAGSAIGDVVPSDARARFAGQIDELCLYNRPLDSNEIAALYAAGSAGKCYTNDPAPVFLIHPENQIGCSGSVVQFTSFAMGYPRPSYQWLREEIPLLGATNATFQVAATLDNAGEYSVVVSNSFGIARSANATLAVGVSPAAGGLDDFERATLGSCMTISRVGSFNSPPGIKATTLFGSSYAFGFGRSTCGASCFGGFTSRLSIPLSGPNFIRAIQFNEAELYDNWGSHGYILLDGVQIPNFEFSRSPSNNRRGDTAYRTRYLEVNRTVTNVAFYTYDITSASELFIDDLEIKIQPPIINLPESFELGWGDWWSDSGYYWRIGRPSNGPGGAHLGTNAAFSNAGGNYFAGVNSRLSTPRFVVPSVSGDVRVILRGSLTT